MRRIDIYKCNRFWWWLFVQECNLIMCSEFHSHDWQLIVNWCLSQGLSRNPITRDWNAISTHGKWTPKNPRTESRVSPTTTTLSRSRNLVTVLQVNKAHDIVSIEVYVQVPLQATATYPRSFPSADYPPGHLGLHNATFNLYLTLILQ